MFFSPLIALAAFAVGTLADSVSYDPTYDNAGQSTDTVSCSNLANQFPTFGSFPSFPNIGGAQVVTGFGSPGCGTCWQLTDSTTGVSIFVTAIDVSLNGFNIAEEAMNTLTDGQAVFLGRIDAGATQVAASNCGL